MQYIQQSVQTENMTTIDKICLARVFIIKTELVMFIVWKPGMKDIEKKRKWHNFVIKAVYVA